MSAAAAMPAGEKTFMGQPRALVTLFLTEMWERFSFYGMRAILVLFLAAPESDGGLGFSVAEAAALYGLYNALVYVAALPGGWVADHITGARKAVLYGGIVIAIGHFTMALPGTAPIYVGLLLIILGTGLLKPNMSAMVGRLYADDDPRRDSGFSIFYMGINLGALLAPLICGYLGQEVNWRLGFAAAGVGMTLGLLQYWIGVRSMGDIGTEPGQRLKDHERSKILRGVVAGAALGLAVLLFDVLVTEISADLIEKVIGVLILAVPVGYFVMQFRRPELTGTERSRLKALVYLFAASAVFWILYCQAGSTLSIFAEDKVNDEILGISFPASFFQSVNPVFILALAPVMAWLWIRLGSRQPSTPIKFSLGLLLVGFSFLVMMMAADAAGDGKTSAMWLIGVYFVQTVGELCISPVGLSTATKLSPASSVGTTMGIWFLSISAGDVIGGYVAGLYDEISLGVYFGLLGLLAIAAGVLVVVGSKHIIKLMDGLR
ncbi:MAG: peptide MFS transporter [Thermoleophilaceae bacterium]|nr:peptide MFS transporter [Thermoleophilaceae bacterium]